MIRLGVAPSEIIDFSSNSNPFPFPLPPDLIRNVVVDHYPDSESTTLRQLIAKQNSIKIDNVLVGSGSMEIIRLVALAYFSSGDKVVIVEPTFGEYETACFIAGVETVETWTQPASGFRLNVSSLIKHAVRIEPKAIFICNPNNPTGQYLSREDLESIVIALPQSLVILDEAYIAFTDGAWVSTDFTEKYDNLIIVRSMTKDFALAGLRLGYCLADKSVISNLCKVRPPWNVNAVAQKAGEMALLDGNYLEESEKAIAKGKLYLVSEIEKCGFKVVPSRTNFFLIKVGNAKEVRAKLIEKGLMVRDCTSFGLPDYIRIAPRTMEENRKLIKAIKLLT